MNCTLCGRKLNTSDATTKDCGGDCLKCMAEIADDPDCIKEMETINIHEHCWGGPYSKKQEERKYPEHLVCCGCGLSHPSIRASIESARKIERRLHISNVKKITIMIENAGLVDSAKQIEQRTEELLKEQDKNYGIW